MLSGRAAFNRRHMSDLASDQIKDLLARARQEVDAAGDMDALEALRIRYLGRKGEIVTRLQGLKELPPAERPAAGASLNSARDSLEQTLSRRRLVLKEQALTAQLARESIDIGLPGRGIDIGSLHPITMVLEQVEALFRAAGFSTEEGPEVEDELHNFTALNIPAHHPARDMHDTFYLQDSRLLRTHTSPVQVRVMQRSPPPLQIICPGRVYRRDMDVSHTPMFHQVEGLWVDRTVTLADLRGVVTDFLRCFFEREDLPVLFRPSYFPFTEPSAEVDIGCVLCDEKGCRTCGHSGRLEVMGCGMVHPEVFAHVGLDAGEWSGFAFGLGIERLAMLRYGVDDIRLFFENDLRFLAQFGSALGTVTKGSKG